MELATIFLIWLAITVIDNMSKRKKRRLQPPETPDFEIPTIAGAPPEEIPIFIENPRQAEVQPVKPPTKRASAQIRKAEEPKSLNLTPSTVMNAFVLSEIIGKPKSLRRR